MLGPCRCQGCGQEVIYEADGERRLGWLHEDGRYRCVPRIKASSRQEYNCLWMRQKRAKDPAYRERERAYAKAYKRRLTSQNAST